VDPGSAGESRGSKRPVPGFQITTTKFEKCRRIFLCDCFFENPSGPLLGFKSSVCRTPSAPGAWPRRLPPLCGSGPRHPPRAQAPPPPHPRTLIPPSEPSLPWTPRPPPRMRGQSGGGRSICRLIGLSAFRSRPLGRPVGGPDGAEWSSTHTSGRHRPTRPSPGPAGGVPTQTDSAGFRSTQADPGRINRLRPAPGSVLGRCLGAAACPQDHRPRWRRCRCSRRRPSCSSAPSCASCPPRGPIPSTSPF